MTRILWHPVIEENAGIFWRRHPHWIMELCPSGRCKSHCVSQCCPVDVPRSGFRYLKRWTNPYPRIRQWTLESRQRSFRWSFAGCTPALFAHSGWVFTFTIPITILNICAWRYSAHSQRRAYILTLILLTWRIWWAPNKASRWQTGFNSAFKGLM
jgi:hypothetical protein